MDASSIPVKKKPKPLPKPILDPKNCSFSKNKDVKQLERSVTPKVDSRQFAENHNIDKSCHLSGTKPPLLPKPKNLKKSTFSSPNRQNQKILRPSLELDLDTNSFSVTDVTTEYNQDGNYRFMENIVCEYTQNKKYIGHNKYNSFVTEAEDSREGEDSSNPCVSNINELKPVPSESQLLSLTEENEIIINEISDNIVLPQTDVEKIVASTWATLQDSTVFDKYVNIKSNSHVDISSKCSDASNFNVFSNTVIHNESTLYSLSQDCTNIAQISCKSSLNNIQPLNSIGELVKALHTVKVEHLNNIDSEKVKKSSNEPFLHSLKKDKEENSNNQVDLQEKNNTSPQKLPKESTSELDVTKSDNLDEHSESFCWSECTDPVLSRSNSIGSSSCEGPASIKRRFNWWSSFGKGNKNKEIRESCLFYYDHSEMDDDVEKQGENLNVCHSSINDDLTLPSEVKLTQSLLKVPQNESNFDDDSNRSSVSDESFDVKHVPKLNSKQICSTVQNETDKRKQKCYFIANELVSSEKVFVDVLKLICIDFKRFIENVGILQKNPVIPVSDLNRITNSLPPLLDFNKDFLLDLESRLASWNEVPKIADVIVKKGPFLRLYFTYIQNFQVQTDYLDECCQKYAMFLKAVKDFEASERCKKLALKHYMLKPIQRIPQYRLLLEDYLEHQDEGSIDYADTQTALQIVCDIAEEANRSIKQGDNLSKLLSLQSQLGNYEIIKPGREFVMEGVLYKLSRKEMQLRFFILLSDCLLYTSHYGSMTGLRVKNKLPLCGMKVTPAHDKESTTEFSIITSTRSFTLRAKSEEECEAWLNALQNAIRENNSRQMTFVNMNFVPMNEADQPLKLGREAPVWIPDKRVTMCQVCTAEFTVTFRRHHCRACGKVVCGLCFDYKAPLQFKKFQPCKVCEDCFEYLLKELDDPLANMQDVIKNGLSIDDNNELTYIVDQIRSSFKRSGQGSGKKVKKYIPQRLQVTANDSGSQMSGWLWRRSRRIWKRLWFVLKEQVLYVYKASEDVVALESIPVLGYTVDIFKEGEYEDSIGDCRYVFQLMHAGQCPLVFGTDSQLSAERWISAIRDATLLK